MCPAVLPARQGGFLSQLVPASYRRLQRIPLPLFSGVLSARVVQNVSPCPTLASVNRPRQRLIILDAWIVLYHLQRYALRCSRPHTTSSGGRNARCCSMQHEFDDHPRRPTCNILASVLAEAQLNAIDHRHCVARGFYSGSPYTFPSDAYMSHSPTWSGVAVATINLFPSF